MQLPIYLDNNATTRVDPRVLEKMLPYFTTEYGNAASKTHAFGWNASGAVEEARQQIAALIGARKTEILFTSGATESNNLALFGAAQARPQKSGHIITGATEHKAVLDPVKILQKKGFTVSVLRPDTEGHISAAQVEAEIRDDTFLVSLMFANNEIGSYHPIAEIGAVTRPRGILFHTDAAQAIGRAEIDVKQLQVDLLSISGHKIYGPKGIGALYVSQRDPRVQLRAQIFGGGHERGMRSGTLAVPSIVGLGCACKLMQEEGQAEGQRLFKLTSHLAEQLQKRLSGLTQNGDPQHRLPGLINISFRGIESDSLLLSLSDIALSSGSACTSQEVEPSYVLRAIGRNKAQAHSSIRFGLGRFNTPSELEYVIEKLVLAVNKLRK